MAKRKKAPGSQKASAKNSKSVSQPFLTKVLRWVKILTIAFFTSTIGAVFFYKWVDPPLTFLMAKRKLTSLFNGSSVRLRYDFVPYDRISDYLKLAVIASEDQKFPIHHGFDLVSIAKAMEHNKLSRRKHGASTISQQTAKNVFLWDGRNFIRKGLEAYFTFLIELIWGKKRILEVYLNVAEMGYLTFGAEEAAHKYFKKPARKLSQVQAAAIAAVLPNPILYKVNQPSRYVLQRKAWILQQMHNLGIGYLNQLN